MLITDIRPHAGGGGAPLARSEHLHGGIIGEDGLALADMAPDGFGQRFQQPRGLSHPSGQGGAFQLDAFAGIDLALAVKRQVIAILGDEDMRQEPRSGTALLDGA
ncbi:hypothetical protein MACH15_09640 [Maricaulis maris]|nr:hypothetical protein MACH15_09640 [Maricaulis maris]